MRHVIPLMYVFAVLFLPLGPAYLLYKLLPSDTSVRGPFRGLSVNLKGAFGGYFLLVLVATGFVLPALSPSKASYEVWQIEGRVSAANSTDEKEGGSASLAGLSISISPPTFEVGSDGAFSATVVVLPGHVEGERKFPSLVFNRPGFEAVTIPLSAAMTPDLEVDPGIKRVTLKRAVGLKRLPEKTVEPVWKR